jgi:uncharacterized protein (DUF952 family)
MFAWVASVFTVIASASEAIQPSGGSSGLLRLTPRNDGQCSLREVAATIRKNPEGIMTAGMIYKICPEQLWREAEVAGVFKGAAIDLSDGYIHFSTAAQARETASRHFTGQANLLLIAVDGKTLGAELKYEASRGGDLFPHLYGELPMSRVRWIMPLRLGSEGNHLFPEDMA